MLSFFDRFPAQYLRWLSIGSFIPIAALNLWLILKAINFAQPLVSILVTATLLAFLLNYPVRFLQQRGIDRRFAVISVLLLILGLLIGASITVLPLSTEELGELVNRLPELARSAIDKLQVLQNWATEHHIPIRLNQWTNQFTEQLPNRLQALGNNALDLVFSTLGGVSNVVLTAIFTVYLLFDNQQLWNSVLQRLPAQEKISQARQSLQQNFQNYFIGQAIVVTVAVSLLTLAFLVLGLPFPLLLGAFIGISTIVPFGPTLASFVSVLLLAADDPSVSLEILGVSIMINQIIDQVITPRLVGSLIGLRPMSVLLTLLIGAKISGLVGLLIAVPIASFLKDAIDGFPSAKAAFVDRDNLPQLEDEQLSVH